MITKPKTPIGRKLKLTPEVHRQLVAALEGGAYVEGACALAGIHEATFYRWMQRGEAAKRGLFREFCEAVRRASAKAEIEALERITEAGKKDWRAAAWFLEHRFPDRWKRRESIEMSGPEGAPLSGSPQPSVRVVIATDKGEIISDSATFPPEDDKE